MAVLDGLISAHSLSDAIELFMIDGRSHGKWTKKTEQIYEDQLGYFKKSAPATIEAIDKRFILEYLEEAGKGRRVNAAGQRVPAPYQRQQAFRILRTFFNWCTEDDQSYIEKSPVPRKGIGKPVDRIHVPPSKEQIGLLLSFFDDSFVGRRNKALIYVYANTGARLCEILADFHNDRQGMQDADIDLRKGEINILGKGRIWRTVGVDLPAIRAIVEYQKEVRKRFLMKKTTAFWLTEEGQPLQGDGFGEALRRMMKKVESITGHKFELTTHDLRKYLCQSAHESGLNTLEIMQISGHKSPKMVQHYTKASDGHAARAKLAQHSPVAGL